MSDEFRLPIADCRLRTGLRARSSVHRSPSSALCRPSSAAAGFTLAEVLVALACALVITVAAASVLITVLRSERAQWSERRASQQAGSWLAAYYTGRGNTEPAQLRRVEPAEERAKWQWLTTEPATGGLVRATVWTRTRAGAPAQ